MWKLDKLTVSVALVVIWSVTSVCAASGGRCRLQRHLHKAMQTDLNGRRCWDDVHVMTCWGYCHSYEISDWQFPYKKSHHPVCVHAERRHASTNMKYCDPNVEPGTEIFHFVEAASCGCQVRMLQEETIMYSQKMLNLILNDQDS